MICNFCCLADAVGHADTAFDVSGQCETWVTGLQFVDRFEAGAAALFVLRNRMFVAEDTDHVRFCLFREFQHSMKLVSDKRL